MSNQYLRSASPEHNVILRCLAAIRWRLFSVRLLERLTIALQWGAAVGLFLTGSRLLRNGVHGWEERPYTAAFLALIPLLASIWMFHAVHHGRLRFPPLGFSPIVLKTAAVFTAALSLAMTILTFHPAGGLIPVWMVPTATVTLFLLLAAATIRPVDNRRVAIFVDRQVGLHERVSTALELLEAPAPEGLEANFRTPVIASALAACQQVRAAAVGYRRMDSRLYASAATVALAAVGLALLSPIQARATNIRKPTVIQVTKAKDLQAILKEIEEKKLPNDKVTAEKLKPLQNTIQQLQQGTMSPIEQTAVLNEAKQALKREQDAMAAADKVQEMLKAMSQTSPFAQAADDMKKAELQKAQGDGAAAAHQKAAEQALEDAANTLAEKMKSGQMSQSDKDQLAKDLKAAADKAAADPQLQKDLQNAADAAKSGDSQQFSESLQDAGQRMASQSAGAQMSQGAIGRAMAEIDRMQNQGGPGSQSTMGQSGGQQGNQGNDGNQGGNQGNDGNQNGSGEGQGQAGGRGGQQGGAQQGGQAGGQPGGEWSQTNGTGSTMLDSPGGPGGHQEGPIGGKESFVRIYDPVKTSTGGNQEKVGSFINPLGAATGSMEVIGQADKNDPSIKSYKDVLPDARQQAMDELTRQEYPPQYQEMVRRFYEK
jgi:hypothetical protein